MNFHCWKKNGRSDVASHIWVIYIYPFIIIWYNLIIYVLVVNPGWTRWIHPGTSLGETFHFASMKYLLYDYTMFSRPQDAQLIDGCHQRMCSITSICSAGDQKLGRWNKPCGPWVNPKTTDLFSSVTFPASMSLRPSIPPRTKKNKKHRRNYRTDMFQRIWESTAKHGQAYMIQTMLQKVGRRPSKRKQNSN